METDMDNSTVLAIAEQSGFKVDETNWDQLITFAEQVRSQTIEDVIKSVNEVNSSVQSG